MLPSTARNEYKSNFIFTSISAVDDESCVKRAVYSTV